MKFSTKEDIEAPAEAVFDALSDFGAFERLALRRGAEVSRVDPMTDTIEGLTWSLRFPVRGKMRRVVCELQRHDRPNSMYFTAESNGFEMTLTVGLVALSRARTRLGVVFEIKPRSLTARLMLQSVRLNKSTYVRRFEGRVQKFGADVELRHAKQRAT